MGISIAGKFPHLGHPGVGATADAAEKGEEQPGCHDHHRRPIATIKVNLACSRTASSGG
jgi:hypothetical protein